MNTIDKAKDTIRKLLDLAADDAAAENEIENAIRFARKLMDKHNLSEDDLPQADERIIDMEKEACAELFSQTGYAQWADWHKELSCVVCRIVPGVIQMGDAANVRHALNRNT